MTRVRREYVDAAWGQVHATRAGEDGPWVVLFHESPLSGEVWVPVLERLGASVRAVALDTPGYGASDPPDGRDHELVEYADVLAEAVRALGVEDPVLCGSHTGASLAVEVAHRVPGVRGVALSGIPLYTDAERAEHVAGWTPPVPIDVDGSQFRWAVERYHRNWPQLDAGLLHLAVVQLLRVAERYDWGYQSVFRHDPAPALAALEVPVLLLAAEHDMLADKDDVALRVGRDVTRHLMPGLPGQAYLRDPDAYAAALADFVHGLQGGGSPAA